LIPQTVRLLIFLVLSFSELQAATGKNLSLTISTFNIAFYGTGGRPNGTPADEVRDPFLKTFIKDSIPASDIMVFEEIVDVPRFVKLLPENTTCLSYDLQKMTHQHVVLCHNNKYKFEKEASDDNFLIDEVAGVKKTLRPAVTAIVTDMNGNKLFRMVAVHLKATPEFSKLRVAQAEMIANYLGKLKNSNLPVMVVGDFNTFSAPLNQETVSDTQLILNALNITELGIKRIPNELYTFREITYGLGQFDQFYLSDAFKVTKPLKIFDLCNTSVLPGEGTLNLEYYNKNISDHCPVTAEISL
jgi:endonuclease/exonuclease/phosphatase family metal-dependent hydrolase